MKSPFASVCLTGDAPDGLCPQVIARALGVTTQLGGFPAMVRRLLALTTALLVAPAQLHAIIIRHDRDDRLYRELGEKYPQLVHMNTQSPGKPPDGEGTLIRSSWVVTAAHIATLLEPGHVVTTAVGNRTVAAVFVHPQWADGPNDIALVKLTEEVDSLRPARLYRQRDEAGLQITVVGIGDTGTGRTGPTGNDGHVRGATNRVDTASDAWLKFVFDQGAAATELEGISGPGDSGGPAFIKSGDDTYLVGVGSGQSTRATGGREGLYGVTEYYARVSSYVPWLEEVMNAAERDVTPNPSYLDSSGQAAQSERITFLSPRV